MTEWIARERPTSTRGRTLVASIYHDPVHVEAWARPHLPALTWDDLAALGRIVRAGCDVHHDDAADGRCERVVVMLAPGVDRSTFLAALD
jgi:hypothetical protein